MKKKIKYHQEQIEELRDMSNNNKHAEQQKKSSLRGRTYSEISLDLTAYDRHRHNKELIDQDGSEFFGFTNELFKPDPVSGWNDPKGRRPSVGHGQNRETDGNRKTLHRIPSYSEINSDFPPPPFEMVNPIYDNSTQSMEQTPTRSPPASPAPPPPPASPQPPSSMVSHPLATQQKQQNKTQGPKTNSSSTIPINSLLDEFKNKIKNDQNRERDDVSSEEEGRLVRASTFSRANTEAPPKKGSSSTDVNNRLSNVYDKPRRNHYEIEDEEDENEFVGFRNRTFDPDFTEASSRF